MDIEERIKLFGLNNLSIESDMRRIERLYDTDLGHKEAPEYQIDPTYYPQFAERLRDEAARMSTNYAIFYCLENSIRELIVQRLEEEHGANWWNDAVPEQVRSNAQGNQNRELSSGITLRSTEPIDYTTFGELAEIIKKNWDVFDDTLRDVRAVTRVLATLNTLRAPIAHCKALAKDEEVRLHLGLRDWFRQME